MLKTKKQILCLTELNPRQLEPISTFPEFSAAPSIIVALTTKIGKNMSICFLQNIWFPELAVIFANELGQESEICPNFSIRNAT